jgi:hypothetical protein
VVVKKKEEKETRALEYVTRGFGLEAINLFAIVTKEAIGEDSNLMTRAFAALGTFDFPLSFSLAMRALQKFTRKKIWNGIINSFDIFNIKIKNT